MPYTCLLNHDPVNMNYKFGCISVARDQLFDMFIPIFFRTITLVGVRRLLEEDLGLDKNTLDPFKKFISQQIDQVKTMFRRALFLLK